MLRVSLRYYAKAAPRARAVDIRACNLCVFQEAVPPVSVRIGHGVPDGVEAIRELARKGLVDVGFLTRWSP